MGMGFNNNFNPDEPRDALGRWTSSGSLAPAVRSWRHRSLGALSAKERAGALAAHAYISLSLRQKRLFGWADQDTGDWLTSLLPQWASDPSLNDSEFRDRYLGRTVSLVAATHLRGAAETAMRAETAGEMADAGDQLAQAFNIIGADDWPHVLSAAEEKASDPPAPAEQSPEFVHDLPTNSYGGFFEPNGERNDEREDLLIWIANAKKGDEEDIRLEIKRLYNDIGDWSGGGALNRALDKALQPGITRQDREKILKDFDFYTYDDSAEIARALSGFLMGGTLGPAAVAEAVERELAEVAALSLVERIGIWKMGWAARGKAIEKLFGQNLADGFPVIDRFVDGLVTSIKTIDLRGKTYQDSARLFYRLSVYIRKVADFAGARYAKTEIKAGEITTRLLHVIVPEGELTAAQKAAFQSATELAKKLGVDIQLTRF